MNTAVLNHLNLYTQDEKLDMLHEGLLQIGNNEMLEIVESLQNELTLAELVEQRMDNEDLDLPWEIYKTDKKKFRKIEKEVNDKAFDKYKKAIEGLYSIGLISKEEKKKLEFWNEYYFIIDTDEL